MKKEIIDELLVKWVDGSLSPEEKEKCNTLFEEQPELKEGLESSREVISAVRKEIPASVDPPYGDFFNSQLMRKVDLQIESRRPARRAEKWWQSLRWAWAPVGALALVLAFFAGHRIGRPEAIEPQITQSPQSPADTFAQAEMLPTVYFTSDALQAQVIPGLDGEVSAIVVDGLTAIADDVDFSAVTSTVNLPDSYRKSEAKSYR